MYTIEVDFEVYKALTLRRATEDVSYNDVLRELLELGRKRSPGLVEPDWVCKGVRFPSGTELRRTYKGKEYVAQVKSGQLYLDGKTYNTPSAAAIAVTGGNVNGWNFWEARFPGSNRWDLLSNLRNN